jgi:hypothetical protein
MAPKDAIMEQSSGLNKDYWSTKGRDVSAVGSFEHALSTTHTMLHYKNRTAKKHYEENSSPGPELSPEPG